MMDMDDDEYGLYSYYTATYKAAVTDTIVFSGLSRGQSYNLKCNLYNFGVSPATVTNTWTTMANSLNSTDLEPLTTAPLTDTSYLSFNFDSPQTSAFATALQLSLQNYYLDYNGMIVFNENGDTATGFDYNAPATCTNSTATDAFDSSSSNSTQTTRILRYLDASSNDTSIVFYVKQDAMSSDTVNGATQAATLSASLSTPDLLTSFIANPAVSITGNYYNATQQQDTPILSSDITFSGLAYASNAITFNAVGTHSYMCNWMLGGEGVASLTPSQIMACTPPTSTTTVSNCGEFTVPTTQKSFSENVGAQTAAGTYDVFFVCNNGLPGSTQTYSGSLSFTITPPASPSSTSSSEVCNSTTLLWTNGSSCSSSSSFINFSMVFFAILLIFLFDF